MTVPPKDTFPGLAERLKLAIKQQQLTPHRLATELGLNPSYIYDILRKRSQNPTIKNLTIISKRLNVSVDHLLYGHKKR